jgi:hypothetical protein
MRNSTRTILAAFLIAVLTVCASHQVLAIAISPGSDVTAGLGNTANAIVRISAGGFVGSGTVVDMEVYGSGTSICVLTADHVIRDAGGGGSNLYAPSQISVGFGNQGAGGASFTATAAATMFDLPMDGSSAVDLALVHVFIPTAQAGQLPAGLAPVGLPNAQPAAGTAIVQAGYGLQGAVATVSGNLAYVYSAVNGLGAAYGTLKAGPNAVGAGGVTNLTGAVSDYAGQNYAYAGFQNGTVINGVSPNYNNSTSYIFSGDSGGPSLSGNTILGVHSSSVTGALQNDANAEFARSANAGYYWSDVSVFDALGWINQEMEILCVPEPGSLLLMLAGSLALLVVRRHRRA